MAETDQNFESMKEVLENDLLVAKTNLVKESIRLAYTTLGEFFYSRGDLSEAFRQYSRTRDYCTTSQQTLHLCIEVVKCALEMKHYLHVNTFVQKAEALPDAIAAEPDALAKLRAAHGVALLAQGKYTLAAKAFTSLPTSLGASSFADVVSAGDVATYGTLCVLSSMDRADVAARVIDSATFRQLMSHAPVEIRDAATDFYGSRYGVALTGLGRLLPFFALDPFLADHAQPLLTAVRARALTQYTKPFATLNLGAMAAAFNMDEAVLQKELVSLISKKVISGRIDTQARALLSEKSDARSEAYQTALKAAEEYLLSTKMMLLRAGMMRHDLVQRHVARPDRPERGEGPRGSGAYPRGEGGGGGGGRRRGGRDRHESGGVSGWADRLMGGMDHHGGGSSAPMNAD